MARVDHPRIPGVSVEVPTKDVKRWERSGWVKPNTSTEKPSPSHDEASTTPTTPPDAANEKE